MNNEWRVEDVLEVIMDGNSSDMEQLEEDDDEETQSLRG